MIKALVTHHYPGKKDANALYLRVKKSIQIDDDITMFGVSTLITFSGNHEKIKSKYPIGSTCDFDESCFE